MTDDPAAIAARLTKAQQRDEEIYEQIRAGIISSCRQAINLRPRESWGTIRNSLKRLRDLGKIEADREYTYITALKDQP